MSKCSKRGLMASTQCTKFSTLYKPEPALTMAEEESKHRIKLPLYDMHPYIENCWVAPSATIIGEVTMKRYASVWYNSVVRGDINKVEIGEFVSIGENTVIHTAASLPTGMTAKCTIDKNTTIGANCTIYSAHIEEDVVIGDRCVILEGARIEKGAQIAPGSVVPPGRLIPTKQLWGGNPCKFIKDLDIGEIWANYTKSYVIAATGEAIKEDFTLWNSSYMDRTANIEDAEPDSHEIRDIRVSDYYKGIAKHYI